MGVLLKRNAGGYMLPESCEKCRGIAFRRFIAAQKSSSEKSLTWEWTLAADFRAKLGLGTMFW